MRTAFAAIILATVLLAPAAPAGQSLRPPPAPAPAVEAPDGDSTAPDEGAFRSDGLAPDEGLMRDDGQALVLGGQQPRRVNVSVARLVDQAERMVARSEFDDALEVIERGMRLDPTYVPLWLVSAKAYMGLGRHEDAVEALEVCLKRDPRDREAKLLGVLNILNWKELPDAEKATRLAAITETMSSEEMNDLLAALLQRDDFPALMKMLLKGWKAGDKSIVPAKTVMQLFEANRLDEARLVASSPQLSPVLARAFHEMLDRVAADGGVAAWTVERGELAWTGDRLLMTAPPKSNAFAWHRSSVNWRDMEMTLGLYGDGGGEDKGGDKVRREVYLRYSSPSSFIRLVLENGSLIVQERLPDLGIAGIFERPLSLIEGGSLKLILKGERLGMFVGGKPLTDDYLAISPPVEQGGVVLACDNPGETKPIEAGFDLQMAAFPERWATVRPGADMATVVLPLMAGDNTGLVIPMTGSVDPDWLIRTLMAGVNRGVKTFALPAPGDTNLSAIFKPLAALPEILATNLWYGVIVRAEPERNEDGEEEKSLGEAVDDAVRNGLHTAVLVDAAAAGNFSAQEIETRAGWVLCRDVDDWPAPARDSLSAYDGEVLYAQGPEIFSAVPILPAVVETPMEPIPAEPEAIGSSEPDLSGLHLRLKEW